ncbi:MAG: NAD(P)/FAD-dependent oxidoreductase [Vallitalea sp.]|nr:NAD(P)/FAD-dependent oxidoreductase [Vallitalea sp.]
MNYDVIIIGAGNGGLSAAATLAMKGKKLLVLERHNIPGGCGTSFRRGRFEFEVALHQLNAMGSEDSPGALRKLFREYGIENQIDWIEINSLFKVNLPNDMSVVLPANREESEAVLIEKFPEEKQAILDYFKVVYQLSKERAGFTQYMSNPVKNQKEDITKMFPSFFKYGLKTTQEVLNDFFDSTELQLCLSPYWCFMGMSPDRFPFLILAGCTYSYIEEKPYYLRGGSQVMSQALTEVIRKNDGEIKFNCGVKRIILENNKAVGVIDDNGAEYKCKKIISNISPINTYYNLLDSSEIPIQAKEYLKGYTIGISAFSLFIGLDCTPSEVGFTDSFNLIYDDLDVNEEFKYSHTLLPEFDPLVATCYTIDDPKVSPPGTTVVSAGVLKYGDPWMELSPEKYYDTKYKAADIVLNRLETRFPGIRDHIEEIEVATPLTYMRYLDHPGGAIYGYEQDVKSSTLFLPKQEFIENLSFASGWVNSCGFAPNYLYGNGVAMKVLREV